MSINHNLSDPGDLTTCLDPASGIPDGATIGKSYIVRRIFESFLATHPTAREITNADPTPSWLQGDAAYSSYYNIPTDVAVTRALGGDYVRFYFTDDPGLTQSTPNCIVYTWRVHPTSPHYTPILHQEMSFKVSGSSIVTPAGQPVAHFTSSAYYNNALRWSGDTTTSLANVPRIVIWASSNAFALFSFNRVNSSYVSGIISFRPTTWSGYTSSGSIVVGQNFNAMIHAGWNYDFVVFEGISNLFEYFGGSVNGAGPNYMPANCQFVSSIGRLPANLYTLSGTQRLITGKLVASICNSNYIANSGEFEGILLANSSAVLTAGGISQYNSTSRYLSGMDIQDGISVHKMLFQLS